MARIFPIGMQTFAKIRENNAIYIDKTELIYKLTHEGSVYFLSRPRRFGKSLLIDTMSDYFSGRKELFDRLAIDKLESEWKKYPVLRFDFSNTKFEKLEDLNELIDLQLGEYEAAFKVSALTTSGKKRKNSLRLRNIILAAEKKTGQKVVFLVDEYDAPLLDTPVDSKAFEKMRQILRDLYSPLKANDAHIKFIFISGITKFSQLSIFSELNNLNIISMMDEYASICGITEEEMQTQMRPEIENFAKSMGITFDQTCAKLKRKYDGYHFSEKSPDIYNPFSLLKALKEKKLKDYWFETGTPTILVEQIRNYIIDPNLLETGLQAGEDEFNVPVEGNKNPIPVLYQSGYLTIRGFDGSKFLPYTLAYPNEEVREGFIKGPLKNYSGQEATAYNTVANTIINGFNSGNIESVIEAIKAYLCDIPFDAAKRDERFYSTIIFGVFYLATPFLVACERKTATGKADVIVETKTSVYAIEFKLDGIIEEALNQIDKKGYLTPYKNHRTESGKPKKLHKVAVNIDSKKKTIDDWKIVEG